MGREADAPAKPITPATFHILLSLAEAPAHGYHVKRLVEERTDGAVLLGAGTLYAGLRRMEGDGLITEIEAPETEGDVEPGSRWRFYAITPEGRDVLAAEIDRLEADVRAADSDGGRAGWCWRRTRPGSDANTGTTSCATSSGSAGRLAGPGALWVRSPSPGTCRPTRSGRGSRSGSNDSPSVEGPDAEGRAGTVRHRRQGEGWGP